MTLFARKLSSMRVLYRGESHTAYFTDADARVLRGPLRLAIGDGPIICADGHYGIIPNYSLDKTLEACALLKKWPNGKSDYRRARAVAVAQLTAIWVREPCRRAKKSIEDIMEDI